MSSDPKALKDSTRSTGYSQEEAYFFELNQKNLIDFRKKQKEIEERRQAATKKAERDAEEQAQVIPFERKKAA